MPKTKSELKQIREWFTELADVFDGTGITVSLKDGSTIEFSAFMRVLAMTTAFAEVGGKGALDKMMEGFPPSTKES